MQILIETINNKTLTIDVEPNDQILDIKRQIYKKEGIP